MTMPLFSIPPHQFLFNAGSIDKRSYMEMLQLDEAEYNLIKFPQRGVCLYKCGNERYLLEVHAPAYKEKLRLRSYGVPNEETQVFPEIKKKARGIVYKRRVSMPYGDALRYLSRR